MSLQDLNRFAQPRLPQQRPAYPDRSGLVQLTQPLANGGGLGFGTADAEPDGYAEGGRTSADWLEYLLGKSPTRPIVQTATEMPRVPFGNNPEMTKEAHYLYDPRTQTYTWTQPKPAEGSSGTRPASDMIGGSDNMGYGSSAGVPSAGQGLSTLGQTIAAKALGLSQSPLSYLSPVAQAAGLMAGAYLDNQIAGIDRGYQVMDAAPGYGMGTIADINGNISTYSSPSTIANYDRDVFGVDSPATPSGAADYFGGDYTGEGFSGVGGGGGFSDAGGLGAAAAESMADYGLAAGGIATLAHGGQSHLGDYSDGGRLLRGPGDGVSDSIPATIGDKRPARLADGEFVVPARIVSELGNGSTEAGARKLYAMMDRIQQTRQKTVGNGRVAVNSRAEKHLPA